MDYLGNETFRDGQIGNRLVYFKNFTEKQIVPGKRVKYHMISLQTVEKNNQSLDFKQVGNKKRIDISVQVRSKTSSETNAGESSEDNQSKFDLDEAEDNELEFDD